MRFFLAAALIVAITSLLTAQAPVPAARKSSPVEGAGPMMLPPIFRPILGSSGQVFAGTVISVQHNSGSSGALATTSIRFHVDEAIRGVRKNQLVEIKEWAGLWQSGEQYHPGERVLLFLYPPSKLGLTSPVGHTAGRFPIDKGGGVLVPIRPGRSARPVELRRVAAALKAEQE